jgi:excisionase family DNA binding protein
MSTTTAAGLWSVQQTLAHLGIGRTTLHSLVCTKQLPCIRIGRLIRFDPADVQRFIERNKAK